MNNSARRVLLSMFSFVFIVLSCSNADDHTPPAAAKKPTLGEANFCIFSVVSSSNQTRREFPELTLPQNARICGWTSTGLSFFTTNQFPHCDISRGANFPESFDLKYRESTASQRIACSVPLLYIVDQYSRYVDSQSLSDKSNYLEYVLDYSSASVVPRRLTFLVTELYLRGVPVRAAFNKEATFHIFVEKKYFPYEEQICDYISDLLNKNSLTKVNCSAAE